MKISVLASQRGARRAILTTLSKTANTAFTLFRTTRSRNFYEGQVNAVKGRAASAGWVARILDELVIALCPTHFGNMIHGLKVFVGVAVPFRSELPGDHRRISKIYQTRRAPLLTASAETMIAIAADPKHLGAQGRETGRFERGRGGVSDRTLVTISQRHPRGKADVTRTAHFGRE